MKKEKRYESRGPLPPGDKLYTLGPVVAGRVLVGGNTHLGFAKPGHKVFTTGPMVNGRPLFRPKKGDPHGER